MYGTSDVAFPRRIACLSAAHVDICRALGAGDRLVEAPAVGESSAGERDGVGSMRERVDRVLALEPDLILAFSGEQAEACAELIRAGATVLGTNQRSLDDILRAVSIVGGALGLREAALDLVQDIRDEIRQVREYSSMWPRRPRVYFEEWPEPLVAGSRWVSDVIEIAGGRAGCPEFRQRRAAAERVVTGDEVARRDPNLIVACWRGRPVVLDAITARPGWQGVSAVRSGRVHEMDAADILCPGPSVLAGLRRIHELVQSSLEA